MRYGGLETKSYDNGEVVFFIRIKGAEDFFEKIYGTDVLEKLFGHLDRKPTLSEYNNADHFINLNTVYVSDLDPEDYDLYRSCIHDELGSIITRCRGLRDIPYAEARGLVLRMTRWARIFLNEYPYRLCVIHIIDNYVLDILTRVMRHLNRNVMVLSEWFIQPYRRHTFYGELQDNRDPSSEEVQRTIQYLRMPKQVFWLSGMDRINRVRYFFYLYFRYILIYFIRYIWKFKICGNEAYEYKFASASRVRIRNLFINKYFNSVDELEISKSPESFVVIPLHTYPEANVDYWMNDWKDADYYSSLYEVVSFFRAEGVTVLLKEHPGFMYLRDASVYRSLTKYKNVRIIDPYSPSANVLDLVPLLVVWHGTMGIEGIMRGRKVAVYDNTYYNNGLLPTYKNYRHAASINDAEKENFVRHILGGVECV